MAEQFQRATAGEPLQVPAETYNAMLDAALSHRNSGRAGASGRIPGRTYDPLITVVNSSGVHLDWFAAVAIDAPVTLPVEDEMAFKVRVAARVIKPTATSKGRWVLLAQPLGSNEVGRAIGIGITPCKINLVGAGDLFVDTVANKTIPESSTGGPAQILWVAGGAGTATATGEQWALIRIGGGGAAESVGQYTFMVRQVGHNNVNVYDMTRAHPSLT